MEYGIFVHFVIMHVKSPKPSILVNFSFFLSQLVETFKASATQFQLKIQAILKIFE